MLREVEEMSVAETAESLGVSDAVVKTRLHRAHAMLRRTFTPARRAVPPISISSTRCGVIAW